LPIAEKGDTLGELVKCKPSKIYPTTKNSCQARHIRPLARFQRLWPDMSAPQDRHVRPPGQTYPASQSLKLTKYIQLPGRIPEAFPEHVRPNQIPQRLSPGSNIFDPQARFQRGGPDMSGHRPGHVWVSGTPIAILVVQEKPNCPVSKTGLSGFCGFKAP
jgi:hypothetical protein